MTTTGKTVYTFEGDADNLLSAISDVKTALDGLGTTAKKTDKAVEGVSASGKKVKSGLDPVTAAASKTGAAFKKLDQGAGGAGGKLGGMASSLGGVAGGLAAIAGPAAVALAALSAIALAVGTVGAGMIKAVFAADELNKELQKFKGHGGFSPIDKDALKSIETVNNSLGALQAIFKRLTVEVGANVAPVIEELSVTLVKLGLMALDAFKEFAKGKNLLLEFANFVTKTFIKALIAPIDILMNLIRVMGDVATAVGATGLGEALTSTSDSYETLVDGFSRSITDGVYDALGKGLKAVGGATSDYDKRARDLLKTVGITDEAIKKHTAAVKGLLAVLEKLASSVEQAEVALEKIRKANLAALSPLAKARSEFFETRVELDKLEESTRKQIAALDKQIENAERLGLSEEALNGALDARFAALDNLITIEDQRLETLEKFNREALLAAENENELTRAIERSVNGRARYADGLAEQLDALAELAEKEKEQNGESERYVELLNEISEKQSVLMAATEEQTELDGIAHEKRLEWLDEETEKQKEKDDAELERLEKLAEKRIQYFNDVSNAASSYGEMFGSVIDFVMSKNEDLTSGQKKALMVLFRLQQAANVTSIVMDTAAAIMRALAELGPIAGGIAGFSIGVTGAMQAATVLSAPPPFHTGGIIPPSLDGSVNVRALPGESVLSREATARLGEKGVNDLNSGMRGSTPIVVEMVYKHKIFDTFVSDNINKGGPLDSAIMGNRRVGRSGR